MAHSRMVLVALAALALAPLARGQSFAVEVTTDSLNVRSGVQASVLGQAGRGQRFVAAAQSQGWLAIDWAGRRAWISGSYARRVGATAVVVQADALNARSGPDTSYARLATLSRGQSYVRLEERAGWSRIQLDARSAWVSSGYVRAVSLGQGTTPPPTPTPTPTPTPGSDWQSLHRGLTLGSGQIPRRGLANPTLRGALGVSVEPYGDIVTREGRSFVSGLVSSFGGANDTGVTTTETGAITGERLRSLNTPLSPSAAQLAARPGDFYYCAMRFDYAPGRTWWRGARLLVVNPANGRAIVVRCVDWGPHTRTKRTLDLSPQAMRDLGLTTDRAAIVSFADPASPLGPVR